MIRIGEKLPERNLLHFPPANMSMEGHRLRAKRKSARERERWWKGGDASLMGPRGVME